MNITIRQAGFTDIEKIHEIEQHSICSWSYDQFVEELRREFSVLLAAFHDDIVSGYICAWIIGDMAEIHSFAVSGQYLRRGIGEKLLRELELKASEKGCTSILLEVRSRNTQAVNFYRKNGFTETGRRKDYYPGDDAVLMEKKI